jgi:hypothetical protein
MEMGMVEIVFLLGGHPLVVLQWFAPATFISFILGGARPPSPF